MREQHQSNHEGKHTCCETEELGGHIYSWRGNLSQVAKSEDVPLIVALHGGTYTSAYFDIPGHSLLDRATALGIPVVALDRPGYGATAATLPEDTSHAGNALRLDQAIGDLWEKHGSACAGVVLIGHSIGGAIALRIAARHPSWPLLGVAISGIGLNNAPSNGPRLADVSTIMIPQAVKDRGMFGPPNTFRSESLTASHAANAPAPVRELVEVSTVWPLEARTVLANVAVPIHYRQADGDALWVVSQEEVTAFASACMAAPQIDAEIAIHAGHCIDFHRAGAAFHLEQLAFALRLALAASFR